MDGNGRWAEGRGLRRSEGHRQGANQVKEIVSAALARDVKYLTLFGFSTENWQRPIEEIRDLMALLGRFLNTEIEDFYKKKVNLRIIGDLSKFDIGLVEAMRKAEKDLSNNSDLYLTIALGYSGRQDLTMAMADLLHQSDMGGHKETHHANDDVIEMDHLEDKIKTHLQTYPYPDPDLLIRTSGEKRISNFMLWQMAYTELYFTDILWPDFTKKDFDDALSWFMGRDRRFGKVKNHQLSGA